MFVTTETAEEETIDVAPAPLREPFPIRTLAVDQLKRNSRIQPREALDKETIAAYADRMKEGDHFPEVVAFLDKNGHHWLADGFHRYAATVRGGFREIEVQVRPGTKEDAAYFAAGANARHGLPLTNEDKRRVTERLLRIRETARQNDPEGEHVSDREIARHIGVSQPFVSKLQKELFGASVTGKDTRNVVVDVITTPGAAGDNGYHLTVTGESDQAQKIAESLVAYVLGYFRERSGIAVPVLKDALTQAIPAIWKEMQALENNAP